MGHEILISFGSHWKANALACIGQDEKIAWKTPHTIAVDGVCRNRGTLSAPVADNREFSPPGICRKRSDSPERGMRPQGDNGVLASGNSRRM